MSWRLHVNAGSEKAAAKVAGRVAVLLDNRLAVQKIEPDWKIEGQQIATASLALRSASLPDAVVEALRLAGAVAGGWHVNVPEESPSGFHFDGWASGNFRVSGVEFVSWTLSPLPETDAPA